MRKIIIGGIAAATGIAIGLAPFASAGTPEGQGAQKSGLQVASGDAMQNCNQGSGASAGWAILNGPGQPNMIKFINGEVHLVDPSAPSETFDIYLGQTTSNGSMCTMTTDTVSTNAQGIGNGHIDNATGFSAGTYWVVLTQHMSTAEKYASTAVPIQ